MRGDALFDQHPNFGGPSRRQGPGRTVATAAESSGLGTRYSFWDHAYTNEPSAKASPSATWMIPHRRAMATHDSVGPWSRRSRRDGRKNRPPVATLDSLVAGRGVIFSIARRPDEDEFAVRRHHRPDVLARNALDEGSDLLRRYWSGEQVNHNGKHYQVQDVTSARVGATAPAPIWVGRYAPRRQARDGPGLGDGVVPLLRHRRHGQVAARREVRDLVAYITNTAMTVLFEIVSAASPRENPQGTRSDQPLADAGQPGGTKDNSRPAPARSTPPGTAPHRTRPTPSRSSDEGKRRPRALITSQICNVQTGVCDE